MAMSSPHVKIYCENMSMRPSIIKIIMCNFKDVRVMEDCGDVVDTVIRVRDGRPRHNGRFLAAARHPSVFRNFRATTSHSFSVHHSRYSEINIRRYNWKINCYLFIYLFIEAIKT